MKGKTRKTTSPKAPHEPTESDADIKLNEVSNAPESNTVVTKNGAVNIPLEISEKADNFDALNEKYIRLLAEYDNFRKRVVKEKEELYRTASENLMKEILPILDNLDRATEHRNDETSLEEYVNGIALIEEQLRNVLSHAGLVPMKVVGQPFDPNLHDAVLQMETDGYEPGIVAQEVQKGYTLNGRVIRHAKVVVSK
ncbi:nucleotide exchange factor GrpE [Candidatus Latescibacterota bacterium]